MLFHIHFDSACGNRFKTKRSFNPGCHSVAKRSAERSSHELTWSVALAVQVWRSFMLTAMALVISNASSASNEISDFERSTYLGAVEICKGLKQKPMALDLDKRVLCFDGEIRRDIDLSLVGRLAYRGIFVMRSPGGNAIAAIYLAHYLGERKATVVLDDHCLSACAAFILVASERTFVTKNTLVAWHHPVSEYFCPSLQPALDGGPRRLENKACTDAPAAFVQANEYAEAMTKAFLSTRMSKPLFEMPPQSVVVRRLLQTRFAGRGRYPGHLLWTWHPRYYASMFKTKIIYEAYPQSQDEAEAMAKRLGIDLVYDP